MGNKITCKFCKSEIDKKATICPNCRRIIKFSVGRWIALTLFILSIMISIAIMFLINSGDYIADAGNENFTYKVIKSGYDENGFSYIIEGIVTNETDKEYYYVQIEFVCYDSDGNNIGTAWDNTTNLLENENWKFKAVGIFDNAKVDYCYYKKISANK